MSQPDKTEERVSVAVYWPNEGYGGHTICESLEMTDHAVNELIRLGYGEGGKSSGEIHVIRTMREIYIRKPEASHG